MTRYELSPDKIDAVLFCSKSYAPILPRLHEITNKYRTYFHYTITAYGRDIEPGVPDIGESMETLVALSKLVGKQRVAWRYDPVLLTDQYTIERHLDTFTRRGEEDISGAKELEIEPFDSALNAAYLREKCQNSKKPVKSMLLDQNIVAGIGNIYSDEVLFAAGIRPDRACSELTDGDFERLAAAIPERLAFFIEKNAISFEEYALSKGKEYRNTPFLRVYGKSGEPCPACGSTLLRTVIGGRSAVYCPHCQN